MTNRFEEFAEANGLVITGCQISLGPVRVDELRVQYTKFLDGRSPTATPHLKIDHIALLEGLSEWEACVSVVSHSVISQILPVLTEMVYEVTYIPLSAMAQRVNSYNPTR